MQSNQDPRPRLKAADPAAVVPLVTPLIRPLMRRFEEEGPLRVAQDSNLDAKQLQLLTLMVGAQSEIPEKEKLNALLLERYQAFNLGTILDAIKNAVNAQVPDGKVGAGVTLTEYLVSVRNSTQIVLPPFGATFEEVTFFYKRVGLPGVVFLTQGPVVPTQLVIFDLGPCAAMESYSWGAWAYVEWDGVLTYELVASVPPIIRGVAAGPPMTPAERNKVENPVMPCVDGYEVGA